MPRRQTRGTESKYIQLRMFSFLMNREKPQNDSRKWLALIAVMHVTVQARNMIQFLCSSLRGRAGCRESRVGPTLCTRVPSVDYVVTYVPRVFLRPACRAPSPAAQTVSYCKLGYCTRCIRALLEQCTARRTRVPVYARSRATAALCAACTHDRNAACATVVALLTYVPETALQLKR